MADRSSRVAEPGRESWATAVPATSRAAAPVSPVMIHYPTAEEMNGKPHMKNYRVVNANHDRYHVVDQHGLVVVNESVGPPGVWGVCLGSGDPGPPKTAHPQVNIYLDTIRKEITKRLENNRPELENKFGRPLPPGWLEGHVKGAMGYIVAHECGHGVGILHHRKTLPPGSTEDNVSPAQGWMMCTMRYLQGCNIPGAKDPYEHTVKYHDDVLDIMRGIWPWPNTYCSTMDDCKSQIRISDAE